MPVKVTACDGQGRLVATWRRGDNGELIEAGDLDAAYLALRGIANNVTMQMLEFELAAKRAGGRKNYSARNALLKGKAALLDAYCEIAELLPVIYEHTSPGFQDKAEVDIPFDDEPELTLASLEWRDRCAGKASR